MTRVLIPNKIVKRINHIFIRLNVLTHTKKIVKKVSPTAKNGLKTVLFSTFTLLFFSNAIAKPLNSDPAWSKQVFENGFTLYSTQATQRPNDPVELRLVISAGTLLESLDEKGALTTLLSSNIAKQKGTLEYFSADSQPLVTLGYDEVIISMKVRENGSNESVKSAIQMMNQLISFDENTIIEQPISKIEQSHLMVTKPLNPRDTFWLNRIHDSVLVGAEPSLESFLLEREKIEKFHSSWITPDAMKLFVAGKIDNRILTEEINKSFAKLTGVRGKNAPVAVLQPLRGGAILATVKEDSVTLKPALEHPIISLYWDSQWQPIKSSRALEKWWEMELAREAIFTRINKELGVENNDKLKLNIDCNVAFQRQLCGIGISYPQNELLNKFQVFLNQLVVLEEKGITDEEFKKLINLKTEALANLFATYAKTELSTLIDNKIQAEQNGIQDISLEDYQQLRQAYLGSVSKESINLAISKFLSQEATILIRENEDSDALDPAVFLQKYQSTLFPNSK
ncbi:insulinase family protein [Thorsellia kenyensis]|uniref:Insulinase family protein n=1 Tax=Thorsellia kenyensis TaxID=1549888 RepID=A0ABV6C9Y4_9GAMM